MSTLFEAHFRLPPVTENPFDDVLDDVQVIYRGPGGATVTIPAFYDGDQHWCARRAARTGRWQAIAVRHNGRTLTGVKPTTKEIPLPKPMEGGIIRVKDQRRFVDETGATYFPIGHNVAWRSGNLDIPDAFAKMGTAGENWSRVWMCHWSKANLDWEQKDQTLSLDVARYWDRIVHAAEQSGIRFQLVLQHHGPYSSNVNSNWGENPWNVANGGFLTTPEEFFTNPVALQRTRRKLRYAVARWGYSPAILAWELFNEVEWTEGARKQPKAVESWHKAMAAFLRQHDRHGHLVTTSSHLEGGDLYAAMDYLQPHAYPPDLAVAARTLGAGSKPIFYGEIGPSGDLGGDDGQHLIAGLWASLFAYGSGAAQYWAWDNIDRRNLYGLYKAATGFVRESQCLTLPLVEATVATPDGGVAASGPGKGWATATRTEFPVLADGTITGIGEMPSFLQGNAHREMFPRATFPLTLAQAGKVAITVQSVARSGGNLTILADGKVVAEKSYAAASRDQNVNETITAALPAGQHEVFLENRGADWVTVQRIEFSPVGASVRAWVRSDSKRAAFFLRRTTSGPHPGGGTLTLQPFAPGSYRLIWWDITQGKVVATRIVSVPRHGILPIPLPPFPGNIAGWITRT